MLLQHKNLAIPVVAGTGVIPLKQEDGIGIEPYSKLTIISPAKSHAYWLFQKIQAGIVILVSQVTGNLLFVVTFCQLFGQVTFALATSSWFVPVLTKIYRNIFFIQLVGYHNQQPATNLGHQGQHQRYNEKALQGAKDKSKLPDKKILYPAAETYNNKLKRSRANSVIFSNRSDCNMKNQTSIFCCISLLVFTMSCYLPVPADSKTDSTEIKSRKGTYEYDAAFLRKHTQAVIELYDSSGNSRILLSGDYQGRVMTSTATGDSGNSYGWVNYGLLGSPQKKKQFNPVGGVKKGFGWVRRVVNLACILKKGILLQLPTGRSPQYSTPFLLLLNGSAIHW